MSSRKPLTKAEKIAYDLLHEGRYSWQKLFFITTIAALLLAIVHYFIWISLSTPPALPDVDLEQYWGVYPIDMQHDKSIRPYTIEFSDVMVNDLRERLLHRREFTPPLENARFTYGFNTHFLPQVLDFWQNNYNFKEREQFLNKYEQYVTTLQGLDVHYMHVKPKVQANVTVVPLLLIHGWPGSIREFYEIIPKLTTPRPNQDFVFEVIAPSIPGFGFSQAPVRGGMGPIEVSVIFRNLMQRIGHDKFYVQGGDYGSAIGSVMATLFPEKILGYHTNMPILAFNQCVSIYMLLGAVWPSFIVEPSVQDRMYPLSKHIENIIEETGYFHIQATKPDTVGIALSDSPAGLAAYILEKFSTWTNNANKHASDGALLQKFSLTHLLDNVMIYWASNTITTSMRHYVEGYKQLMYTDKIPTKVPTCGIKFKHEISFQPDSILKLKYKNYLHSSVVEDGGHFAAMELPDVLADDIFDAVQMFRKFHSQKQEKEQLAAAKKPATDTKINILQANMKDLKAQIKDEKAQIKDEKAQIDEKAKINNNKANINDEKANIINEKVKTNHEKANIIDEKAKLNHEKANIIDEKAKINHEKAKINHEKANIIDEKANIIDEKANKNHEKANIIDEKANINDEKANINDEKANIIDEKANIKSETANIKSETAKVNFETAKSVYEFTVNDIEGREVKLEKYKGNVLIIVNVASQCGYTNTHYKELNELYEKYSEKGLRILAFPCNQFGGQEPGTLQEILQFTKEKKVKFDLFEKIEVNGDSAHPLWKFLKKSQGGTLGDYIKWNFSKFIIDKNGVPIERFGPYTSPLELEPYMDKLLA